MSKTSILWTFAVVLLLRDSTNAQDFVQYSPSGEYTTTIFNYSNGHLYGISYIAYLKKDKGGLGSVTVSATKSGYYSDTVTTGEILKVSLDFNCTFWPTSLSTDYTVLQLNVQSSGKIQTFAYLLYPTWSAQLARFQKALLDTCTGITIDRLQATAVEDPERQSVATSFSLFQNYPNPFNPTTTISFSLPSKSFVSLKVFDVLGREVSLLIADELTAGRHTRQWNPVGLPSGIYFYRLQAGGFNETKRLLLLR